MSRIGKIPVEVPKEVKIILNKGSIELQGPKGKLSLTIPFGITLENKEGQLIITRANDAKQNRANHGTIRSLLSNMVVGVTQGHKRNLQIQGVGFKGQIKDKEIELNLGFSHSVKFPFPENVKISMPKPTEIEIEGVDKALVGKVAAEIRNLKPPEPYKGKGIRYQDEVVRRKQGKSVTK